MMNNKVNIFEELNKMKSLIHAKSGVVISEQDGPIETIRKNLASISVTQDNEKAIVNTIIQNYKTKEAFEDFLYRYKQNTGDDFAKKIGTTVEPIQDPEQWNALVNHLAKMGINLNYDTFMGQSSIVNATPKLLPSTGTPVLQFDPSKGFIQNGKPIGFQPPAEANITARQKNIIFNYCSVKNGKIENTKSAFNGKTFNDYVSTYTITAAEIAEAKKACPGVNVAPAAPAGPTPTQKFTATATSLGIQNPKMDVATLQTILNTLNQGGSGLTESKNLVNEELNKMKYMLGYQRGRVISEQGAAQPQPAATQPAATQPAATQPAATQPAATQPAATQPAATQPAATQPAATPKDLITQIQTVLKDKYKANLGNFGPNKNGVDGKWGNLTQTALDNALKSIADVKQKRATETQQTATQDTATQQAAEKAKPVISQAINLPTQSGIQQRPQVAGVQTK
jgi:hypothetical protein